MAQGVRVQYCASQNVPKIASHIECNTNLPALHAVPGLDAEQAEPFRAEPEGQTRTRGGLPRHCGERLVGRSRRDVGRERDSAWYAGRTSRQSKERYHGPQLHMDQSRAPAAPLAEFVTKQLAASAHHEAAVRRELVATD